MLHKLRKIIEDLNSTNIKMVSFMEMAYNTLGVLIIEEMVHPQKARPIFIVIDGKPFKYVTLGRSYTN